MSLGAVEATTEKSVALLAELDRVKKNLENCAAILKDADALMTLSKRLENVQLNDYTAIIAQIREVRASPQLHVLQAIPELKELMARLTTYERRLEGHLRPKFVAALRSNDVKSAVEMAAVYKDIGQVGAMRTTYFDVRLEDLQSFWNNYQPPLTSWLPLFYARLQNVVVAETEWCKLLFGKSQKEELSTHLLSHFDAALASRLQVCSLPEVVELHRIALSKAPFEQHIKKYGQLEKEYLQGRPGSLSASTQGTLSSSSFQLLDPFIAAEEAVERCYSLTEFSQFEGEMPSSSVCCLTLVVLRLD